MFGSASTLTLAACLLSTDGLSSGLVAPDGGTPTPEAATTASTPDAGSPPGVTEAGADVASPDASTTSPFFVSTGTAGWCKGLPTAPKICNDFDEASTLAAFDVHQSLASITLDTVSTSPPNALLGQTQPNQSGDAFLQFNAGSSPHQIRMQTDVAFDTPTAYVEFASLEFSYASGGCQLEPATNDGDLVVNEYCFGAAGELAVKHVVSSDVTTGAWYTLLLTVDFDARTFMAIVKKPDGTTDAFPAPLTLNAKIVAGSLTWLPGIAFSQPATPPEQIRLDNTVLDYP